MSAQLFHFKVCKGGQVLREVTLAQDVIKIGRMASSHLQIDDEYISRMHAVIEVAGPGQATIIDLGSETGTLVNGKRVNKSALSSGDTVTLGGIEIYVTISAAEEQAAEAVAAGYVEQGYGAPMEAPVQPAYAAPVAQYAGPAQPGYAAPVQPAYVAAPVGMDFGMRPAPVMPMGMVAAAQERIPTRPAVQYSDGMMEDASSYGTEVITVWQDAVLQVSFYKPLQKKPQNFYVGEEDGCDFPIQSEFLNGLSRVPLVVNHIGGGASATIMPNARGDVTYEDGRRVSLAELIGTGQAQGSAEVHGCYSFTLPPRARVKIDLGDFTFLASSVASPRKLAAPVHFEWSNQLFNGIAFLMHFLVIFLAFFDPSNLSLLSLDFLDDASRLVKYELNPFEMKETPDELNKKDEDEGGKGKRHKLEEGQMGKRDAAKTKHHYGIKGPADNPNPRMARDMAKEMAKEAGILKYLQAVNQPVSPFGSDTPLGVDPENALGALMGDQVGENFGYGGLGLRGTGRGGGGTGEGTIGLGNLGTIGHGGGGGSGSGYGRGAGGLGGRRGRAPRIRSGAAMVKGSLSKEVIRRIVHRHINEVKFCYERELAKRPDLAGRVSIKFIISGSGAVQMAAVAESTVGNPIVENCIAQAVRRWVFPQPEGGGIVIVTYPFQLESPE